MEYRCLLHCTKGSICLNSGHNLLVNKSVIEYEIELLVFISRLVMEVRHEAVIQARMLRNFFHLAN